MSLNSELLKQHCETIIQSRRIKNKIVVLCEGEGGILDMENRPSPHSYREMEKMPDANFYNACVPKTWSQYRPQFFNCGDRKDVLDTYFTVLKMHNENNSISYLAPEKLFAIVDLDIQRQTIDNYSFSDTEAIFHDLYEKSRVNEVNVPKHRIWVTGLIHKEAYFLISEIQPIFNSFPISPFYNGNPVILEKIYIDMANAIGSDLDIQNNLQRVYDRISYCSGLDCTKTENLGNSWQERFQNTEDNIDKNELVLALLTIKKAKDYWNKIQPSGNWTRRYEVYREQLLLEIGRFYSEQPSDLKYHISFFFAYLRKLV